MNRVPDRRAGAGRIQMILGIDFGTSFSQSATMFMDQPMLLLPPGEYGVPSAFYYDSDCGILVGQDALDAGQGYNVANLRTEIKMELGQPFQVEDRTFSPQEMVSEIYKTVIMRARQAAKTRMIDDTIERVVISVPAKFGVQQRSMRKECVENCIPGEKIRVAEIIKEPVAAALAYFNTQIENGKCILVYDLGGGTCDIALVQADKELREYYKVIDSDMLYLGGRDWDRELSSYITKELKKKSRSKIEGNAAVEEKIRRAAVAVKHQLSDPMRSMSNARIELNSRIHTVPVSREKFDEITRPLLQRSLDCLKRMYDKYAGEYRIDEIICVGGSSNMRQVEENVSALFPSCTVRIYEPEHAVVYGAAIFAEGAGVQDIAQFSYGVETHDDLVNKPNHLIIEHFIRKGDLLPASASKRFRPIRDGMRFVYFPVYETSSEERSCEKTEPDIRLIGKLQLQLPEGTGTTDVLTCSIHLNTQGLLEVVAANQRGEQVSASFELNGIEAI